MIQLSSVLPIQNPTNDDLVLEFALWAKNSGKTKWVTRAQIAEYCGRKVTPTLINRIEKLVAEGKLEKDTFQLPNKAIGFVYAIPEEK